MKEELYKQTIFKKEKHKGQMDYWLKVIDTELQPVELPLDFKRDDHSQKGMHSIKIAVPGELARKVFSLCKKSDLTLYVFLLAAFKVFLYRYTRNDQTLVASPLLKVSAGDDGTAEPFKYNKRIFFRDMVNTGLTFKELLLETKNKTLEAYRNQNYPLDLVFKEKGLPIDGKHSVWGAIDRVIFLLRNLHNQEEIIDLKYDLLFSFIREGEGFNGEIYYDMHLFKQESVEKFVRRYKKIVECCIHDLDTRIRDIAVFSQGEVEQLLVEFNRTQAEYPENKAIYQLFEEQARKTPDRIAVVGKASQLREMVGHLSYRELNESANRLAGLLKKRGVGPDCIVALMMEPCLEMIVGILGILKAGGLYLPIDPTYPQERIESLLADSRASILLTKETLIRDLYFLSLQNLKGGDVLPMVTSPRPLVENLDSLQIPDRSYVDYEKYSPYIGQSMIRNSITFHFSRGCMYKCAYCFKIWPNNRYVHRSAENMFEELLLYYKMGVRKFSFVDDLPNFNIKESAKFYQLIVKNRLKVQLFYPNGLRGDILTKDYIDLMIEAGTVSLDVALETTSRRLQKLIGKNLNLHRLHENILYMIDTYPQLILETQLLHGIPTETEEEAQNSLDYLKSLKWIHMPYLHVLKIYPNTDMARLAMEHGISRKAIEASDDLGYNELPDTLPFPRSFTHKYQSEFASDYFMLRERLMAVLPYQMNALSEVELVQKYDSFLPVKISCFSDLLNYVGIRRDELKGDFLAGDYGYVTQLNTKIQKQFPRREPDANALKLLLIDVSAYFSDDRHEVIYDVVEPPLGLMYLQTHLDKTFGTRVRGKIVSSRIDFDCFEELRNIIYAFDPHVIGIRTMNFYKEFFHQTVSLIRQWGVEVPIIVGGPYATSSYESMLKDINIDVAVLGEGEVTFAELIGKLLENQGALPPENDLKNIPGIAFVQKHGKSILKRCGREVLMMDQLYDTLLREPIPHLDTLNKSSDLAYIIYTSGSTGVPKGVLIQHDNLVNQVSGLVKRFDLNASYYYILLAPFTFDVSVMHIFLPLSTGGKLLLIDDKAKKDPLKLWRFIHEKGIDILNIVPAFMKALLENMENKEIGFKYLFVGGDVFDSSLYQSLKKTFDVKKIINIYGPTETTINAALYECENGKVMERIPIGRPLMNYRAYILDRDSNPLPVGVAGELCISGAGVGRGYLSHPELTADKFVVINNKQAGLFPPSLLHQHLRLYRTGDLARWIDDGNIDFLGRIDQQVKIRGYRIEPGEIERQLASHNEVKEVVVLAKEDSEGEKYLCAYVVPRHHQAALELKEYLSGKLPEYMIPSYFVQLEKFPVTSSGKVDTAALPDSHARAKGVYAAPRNEVERALAELWAEVVGMDKEKIGIDSNFFELGGHSLKATILITKIHKKLDINIPMVELFKTPTIRGLSQYLKETIKEKHAVIKKAPEKEYYPLSSAQKRLYILQKMEPTAVAYNLPMTMILEGDVESEQFEKTFFKLIKRHESLRTSFIMVEDQPVQKIHKLDDLAFKVEYYNMEHHAQSTEKDIIRHFISSFDLSKVPLLRVGLIKTGSQSHIFMVDMHHIITDGISENILIKEFLSLYSGEELTPLRLQYKDYSEWQQMQAAQNVFKQQEDYWMHQFEGEIPVLNLPTDYSRPAVQSFEGSEIAFELDASETEALNQMGRVERATLFMVLLALYNVFLSKITGQEEIVVGVPIAGRRHDDLQHIIGMFVNTLALRSSVAREITFKQFLNRVRQQTLEAFENQDYQFEEFVEKVAVEADMSRNPLFDVTFVLQNIFDRPGEIPEDKIKGLKVKPLVFEHGTSKFDLTLVAVEWGEKLRFALEYCTKLFEKETIIRFISHFRTIISSVIENPDQEISEIIFMTDEEKRRVLYEFNETKTNYPKDKTIHELFEEQAERMGDNIAVIGTGTTSITYNQLNEKSHQLAQMLVEKGVKPGDIVGIMVERSIEMIIGIVGILKTGGAYLPIEPNSPEERKRYMLADTNARILLSEVSGVSEGVEVIDLKQLSNSATRLSEHLPTPTHLSLAYVIYTSGTTGRPKGTLINHFNVIRVVRNNNYLELTGEERLLQLSNYAFDGSVFDIYGALLNGAALVMIDRESVSDVERLADIIKREHVTIFFVTTALFNTLVDLKIECFHRIRKVLFGGERVSVEHVSRALAYMGKDRIIHVYGPTETTVFATYYLIDRVEATAGTIPIGKPIANTTAYILDKKQNPIPIGIVGELYIGGDGLARGYLNHPELTAENFDHDFQDNQDEKELKKWTGKYSSTSLYRTGDLARWLPGGNIEFWGRIDHQVKIRGFRVELGEIENQLLKHKNVKETVVIDREGNKGERYLCAYIVPHSIGEDEDAPNTGELRGFLSLTLPDYMIPAYFVYIDRAPLTPNGKIDRKALPEPELEAGKEYVAPRNEVEAKLVEIWSEVLGIEKDIIGIDSNFFALGGHSLKATILVTKIHKEFNMELSLAEMFKTPHIRGIASLINVINWADKQETDINQANKEIII